jgi:hypothetical protein
MYSPSGMAKSANPSTWVAAKGVPPRQLATLIFVPICFALAFEVGGFSLGALLQSLGFSPPGGLLIDSGLVYALGAVLPIIVILGILNQTEIRIGIGDRGIRLVSRLRTRDVPWDALRPSTTTPSGMWGLLTIRIPHHSEPHAFWVTREQARAILAHPNAPRSLFPPEYWIWLGLPPQSSLTHCPDPPARG